MTCRLLVALPALAIALGLAAIVGVHTHAAARPPATATTSAPTTQRSGLADFQPGVRIDWRAREVHVDTHVVLRQGVLEFFACWAGKEHESILRIEPPAMHVYMALGLIGLTPGHPPVWDEERGAFEPPTGDLVDIALSWDTEAGPQTASAADWLREIEYSRTPLPRPWYFTGSRRLPDGRLSSDMSGVGVALVDFSDSLISYSRRYPSRYSELWVDANTEAIPAHQTKVRLVFRPAAPRKLDVRLDFRGVIWLNDRFCSPADLADILKLQRQLAPERVQRIRVADVLGADVQRLRATLREAGLPLEAVEVPNP